MVAIYQLVALMATAAIAAPSDITSSAVSERDLKREPDIADLYTGLPEERDLYDASGLHLRSEMPHIAKRNGWLHCGNMPGADQNNAWEQMTQLGTGNYVIPGRTCLRVKCWNTTGTYVCNDQGGSIAVSGQAIYQRALIIMDHCCMVGGPKKWISGQQFTDSQGGYNVILAYSNCNHDKYQSPSSYGPADSHCLRSDSYIT
jgi:hypothetical protein